MFDDILKIHLELGHAKAVTLYKAVHAKHGKSIPRTLCEEFAKLCPHCTAALPRKCAQILYLFMYCVLHCAQTLSNFMHGVQHCVQILSCANPEQFHAWCAASCANL